MGGAVVGQLVKQLIRIAVFALLPVVAFAQSEGLRDRDPDLEGAKKVAAEVQRANFHYGPFYLWSRLRISDAGFSESFYLPTGDHGGGVSLTVEAPQRIYFVPHKKTVFSAEIIPGYSFIRSEDKNGQFNYLTRADAHFLFNHLYLDAYASRASQMRSYSADVNRLVTVADKEAGVTGELKYSSRTSTFFAARFREAEHPEDKINPDPEDRPVALLDRQEKNGRVAFHHKTFPLTSLMAAAEISKYEFDFTEHKDSTRRYVGAGALRSSGRMAIRLEGGPVQLDFDDPTQEDYEGLTGTFGVSRSAGRWIYGFNADRDLGFSILAGGNYYVANRARVNATYSATRRLTLRGQTTVERDVFEQRDPEGNQRRDTIHFSTLGFLYTIRRVQLGTDVGWLNRTSSFEGDEDEGIRWTLLLSFTP